MSFGFSAGYIAIWVLVLFQGLLIVALLRQLSELRQLVEMGGLRGDDRLPTGSPAPAFSGRDMRTGRLVHSRSLSGSGGIVLFVSPECGVCQDLASSLRQPVMKGLPRIIAFCQGGEKACARFLKRLDSDIHLLVEGAEDAATRFGVSGSPTAVVIDSDRKIRGYGHPKNGEDLRDLFARSVGVDSPEPHVIEKPQTAVFSSKVS